MLGSVGGAWAEGGVTDMGRARLELRTTTLAQRAVCCTSCSLQRHCAFDLKRQGAVRLAPSPSCFPSLGLGARHHACEPANDSLQVPCCEDCVIHHIDFPLRGFRKICSMLRADSQSLPGIFYQSDNNIHRPCHANALVTYTNNEPKNQ